MTDFISSIFDLLNLGGSSTAAAYKNLLGLSSTLTTSTQYISINNVQLIGFLSVFTLVSMLFMIIRLLYKLFHLKKGGM